MSNYWKAVILALLVLALVAVACGGNQPPQTVRETVVVPQTVVVEKTVVIEKEVAAATAVPAPTQAPKPAPPKAVLDIVAVPGNARVANAITTTIKYITDTAVGEARGTAAIYTSGLTNVPVNVPVRFSVVAQNPKDNITKIAWRVTGPKDSKATFGDQNKNVASFTPDLVGAYKVDATITTDGGSSTGSVQLHAGAFIGESAGKCESCHKDKVEEWKKTGHALILSDEIDNKRTPDVPTHYSLSCARCHSTGFYPAPFDGSGGFTDVATKLGYKFPTFKQIDAGGNFAKMPAELKNMANIQCEVCHGPAKEHVTNGAAVMASSQDEGVCNQCHNGGGNHLKGTDLQNAKHSDAASQAWTYPVGPDRQECVRCHSGNGYQTFLAEPNNPAAWDNTAQTVVCSTCHDPHSEANAWQLRIVDKPVALPVQVTKNVGLSATCYECHNGRTDPAAAVKSSFPHYSSVAEFINDSGGVTYGKTIPNSPHGMIVGAQPVANPDAATDPEAAKFMFSKAGDTKGNTPGACVTCHMWPTVEDAKDPNYHKVGSHSFNTVSPDGKFDYTASCKSCHGDKKDFNFTAKADYDGNGKVEGVQDETKGLLNVLWKALEAKGLKKIDTGYPYATLPKDSSGQTDDKIDNAWYNFRVVYGVMWGAAGPGNEGKAQSVHNFQRAVGLLQASYKDLTGQDVPGATLLVK